jgi:hypothetical protein
MQPGTHAQVGEHPVLHLQPLHAAQLRLQPPPHLLHSGRRSEGDTVGDTARAIRLASLLAFGSMLVRGDAPLSSAPPVAGKRWSGDCLRVLGFGVP